MKAYKTPEASHGYDSYDATSNPMTSPIPMPTQPIRSQNNSSPISCISYGMHNPKLNDGSPTSSMTYETSPSTTPPMNYKSPDSSIIYETPTSSMTFRSPSPSMNYGTPTPSMSFGTPIPSMAFGNPTSSLSYGASTQINPHNYGPYSSPMDFGLPTNSSACGSSISNVECTRQINQSKSFDKLILKDNNQSKENAPKFRFKKKTESPTYSNSIMDMTPSNALFTSETKNQFYIEDAGISKSYSIPPRIERQFSDNQIEMLNASQAKPDIDNLFKYESRMLKAMPISGKNFRSESSSSLNEETVCPVSNAWQTSNNDHTSRSRLSYDEVKHKEFDMFKKPLAPMNSSHNYKLQAKENTPFGLMNSDR